MEMAVKLVEASLLQTNLKLNGLRAMSTIELRPFPRNEVSLLNDVWRACDWSRKNSRSSNGRRQKCDELHVGD